jgi:hypothetical protein
MEATEKRGMTLDEAKGVRDEINEAKIAEAGIDSREGVFHVWFWPTSIYHEEFKKLMEICERHGVEMRYEEVHYEGGEFIIYR